MRQRKVGVSAVGEDVYVATPDGGSSLTPYEAMGLIGDLAEALRELAPPEDPRWQEDPRREGVSQTTALAARVRREQAERRRRG